MYSRASFNMIEGLKEDPNSGSLDTKAGCMSCEHRCRRQTTTAISLLYNSIEESRLGWRGQTMSVSSSSESTKQTEVKNHVKNSNNNNNSNSKNNQWGHFTCSIKFNNLKWCTKSNGHSPTRIRRIVSGKV